MRRGTTLVELMVVVAMIGISAGVVSTSAAQEHLEGLAVLQRERALEWLELEAEGLTRGRPPARAVEARLEGDLPGSRLERTAAGGAVTLTVSWKGPGGRREAQSLTVLTSGKAGR